MMTAPDADYRIAFSVFDVENDGRIKYRSPSTRSQHHLCFSILFLSLFGHIHGRVFVFLHFRWKEFQKIVSERLRLNYPFDASSDWSIAHFGANHSQSITFDEFCQMLKGFEVSRTRPQSF